MDGFIGVLVLYTGGMDGWDFVAFKGRRWYRKEAGDRNMPFPQADPQDLMKT